MVSARRPGRLRRLLRRAVRTGQQLALPRPEGCGGDVEVRFELARSDFARTLPALDVPELIRTVMDDEATPLNGPLTALHYGRDSSVPAYPYDPAEARRLIAEAGYNGEKITEHGLALQALADIFDGGPVTAYVNFANNGGFTADIAPFGHGASAVEGFEVHAQPRRIVAAFQLRPDDVPDTATRRLVLMYPEFTNAADVFSVKRVDLSGYATDLKPFF